MRFNETFQNSLKDGKSKNLDTSQKSKITFNIEEVKKLTEMRVQMRTENLFEGTNNPHMNLLSPINGEMFQGPGQANFKLQMKRKKGNFKFRDYR